MGGGGGGMRKEVSSILAVCSNHPSLAESESFGIGPAGVLPAVLTRK